MPRAISGPAADADGAPVLEWNTRKPPDRPKAVQHHTVSVEGHGLNLFRSSRRGHGSRCLPCREGSQQPDLPSATFTNLYRGPTAVRLKNGTILASTANVNFTHRHRGIGSERPNILESYILMIEPGFECILVILFDKFLWARRINQHPILCVQTCNTGCILFVEILGVR